ncbi:LIM domain-containing protein Beadex [Haematobia irritans]|uniref:LIM domain-containing protein Beadex n=1 Tax=Haematobia irritans TaxID=7368 RepID=UPI003F4F860D
MPDLFVNTFVNASMLLNAPKKPGKRRGRKPKAKKLPMYDVQPPPPTTPQMPQLPPQLYNDYVNEYQPYPPPPPPPAHHHMVPSHYNNMVGYDDMSGMNKMMTMDITKTEPNVGPNNLQNANSNQTNNANSNSITAAANNNNNNGSQLCAGCGKHIQDRYLLRALDMLWHEDCLKCGCCDCRLGEVGSTLYTKGNLMLCKRDYLRLFGNTGYCAACSKVIPAFEMVMRARTNVYHLECFACQQCNHRFCVGDRFYLCENKILCEYDYEERLVFASMANHPMLKRHVNSIAQDSPTGAGGANTPGGMMGAGANGPRTPGDLNNNGPQTGPGNSPFGAGAGAHMKNSLGASS